MLAGVLLYTLKNEGLSSVVFPVNSSYFVPFCFIPQLPSHPLTPSRHAEGRAMTVAPTYHTLPHPSSHGTSLSSTMMWGPLEPPNTPKPWSLSCLRPAPPLRPSAALCYKEVSDCVFMSYLR